MIVEDVLFIITIVGCVSLLHIGCTIVAVLVHDAFCGAKEPQPAPPRVTDRGPRPTSPAPPNPGTWCPPAQSPAPEPPKAPPVAAINGAN